MSHAISISQNHIQAIERAVLATALFLPEEPMPAELERLEKEDFFDPLRGEIYTLYVEFDRRGKPRSEELILAEIQRHVDHQITVIEQELVEIISTSPILVGLEHYASEIQEAAKGRKRQKLIHRMLEPEADHQAILGEMLELEAERSGMKDFWLSADQIRNAPATSFLAPELLAENRITTMFAASGQGKSTLALWLVEQIASQEMRPIYYLDLDNGVETLQERGVDQLLDRHPQIRYGGRGKVDRSLRFLESMQYRSGAVIVIDSILNFIVGKRSSEKIASVFELLKSIRDAGNTVIVLHHEGKNTGQIYGQIEFETQSDAVAQIRFVERTKTIVFEPTKSSRVRIKPKAFQVGENGLIVSEVDYHAYSLSPAEMQIYYHVVTILEDGELNQSEICSAVRGAWNQRDSIKPSAKRIKKVLEKLDGQDWNMERGEKNAAIYSLVEQTQDKEERVEEVILNTSNSSLEVGTLIEDEKGSKLPASGTLAVKNRLPNYFQTGVKHTSEVKNEPPVDMPVV